MISRRDKNGWEKPLSLGGIVTLKILRIGVWAQLCRGGGQTNICPTETESARLLLSYQCTQGFRKHYLYNMAYYKSIFMFL